LEDDSLKALKIWRVLIVGLLVILGGFFGYMVSQLLVANADYKDALQATRLSTVFPETAFGCLGGLVAFLLGTVVFNRIVVTGERLKGMPGNEKVAIVIGVIIGLLLTAMLSTILSSVLKTLGYAAFAGIVLIGIILVYLAVAATTSMKDELLFTLPSSSAPGSGAATKPEQCKILDTNVIIDGRVADICRTGFLEGPIYVPGFVLDELQHIADSADGLKRARGRRGLDILNQMRTEQDLLVRTYDNNDPNDRDEVDAKLVKLAKKLDGMIVTNDFNLNKVAELQGVTVLNINELANALKPVVLPGEDMRVTIIKEGKEMNQGVAYLDDGTMIVVEGGRRRIGETLDVVTSSVLQTVAGKMIFATIRYPDDVEEDDSIDRNLRAYPRSGPRRKIQQ
jgi:uncharacterized protein YacL